MYNEKYFQEKGFGWNVHGEGGVRAINDRPYKGTVDNREDGAGGASRMPRPTMGAVEEGKAGRGTRPLRTVVINVFVGSGFP